MGERMYGAPGNTFKPTGFGGHNTEPKGFVVTTPDEFKGVDAYPGGVRIVATARPQTPEVAPASPPEHVSAGAGSTVMDAVSDGSLPLRVDMGNVYMSDPMPPAHGESTRHTQ